MLRPIAAYDWVNDFFLARARLNKKLPPPTKIISTIRKITKKSEKGYNKLYWIDGSREDMLYNITLEIQPSIK